MKQLNRKSVKENDRVCHYAIRREGFLAEKTENNLFRFDASSQLCDVVYALYLVDL